MKIQKLQNYKPKDTRKAVPTHYTLLFDAYDDSDNLEIAQIKYIINDIRPIHVDAKEEHSC